MRFITLGMALLGLASFAPVALGQHVPSARPAREAALNRRNREQRRPVLDQIRSASAEEAAQDPKRLWAFLVDPQTPFADRLAAAARGENQFPPAEAPRLIRALWELREEERLHRWGMKPPPFSSELSLFGHAAGNPELKRVRTILGRRYVLLAQPAEYPLNWKEEQQAPWPWQVREALEVLLNAARPRYEPGRGLFDGKRKAQAEAWLAACLKMPLQSDREAMMFVEASSASSHFQTLPVLARWRQIALDPRFPGAASQVAGKFGDSMRLWDDPRAHGVGQVLIADIVALSPHRDARHQAAYGVRDLRERFREGRDLRMPEPALALLALGSAATDAGPESQWNRLYCYAFSAGEALDRSPIEIDRHLDPQSPEVAKRLEAFAVWFRKEKAQLERTAAVQLQEVAAAAAVVREPQEPGEGKP